MADFKYSYYSALLPFMSSLVPFRSLKVFDFVTETRNAKRKHPETGKQKPTKLIVNLLVSRIFLSLFCCHIYFTTNSRLPLHRLHLVLLHHDHSNLVIEWHRRRSNSQQRRKKKRLSLPSTGLDSVLFQSRDRSSMTTSRPRSVKNALSTRVLVLTFARA